MDTNEFWKIISESRSVLSEAERDGNLERQAEALKSSLSRLDKKELIEFAEILHTLSQELYSWELWGAAYVIGGGCSDDSFSDFRSWIISLGREAYQLALKSPDELGPLTREPTVEDTFFEGLSYLVDEVFEDRFDDELDIDLQFRTHPDGEKWDESSLDSLYPKLSKMYS